MRIKSSSRLPCLLLCLCLCLCLCPCPARSQSSQDAPGPYARWQYGPPKDPDHFPIGVWLQDPRDAAKYKRIGINFFLGLWKGPTKAQLQGLQKARMPVIPHQNDTGLGWEKRALIQGWLHQDEPDNAQGKKGGGYGPPVTPEKIQELYAQFKKQDPDRPVILNLGQGVANDNWIGRGTRTGHLEDYPEYIKGTDIVSFDIYPVTSNKAQVKGKLELVALGVERLVKWSGGKKIVWNVIECTHIKSPVMPTPAQVRSEVWMSLIHGSMGIVYFAHEWQPKFDSRALLHYPAMAAAVSGINGRIRSLARVLNSPSQEAAVKVNSTNEKVPIACMVKKHGGHTWLFAVAMRNAETKARFKLSGVMGRARAEVLDEDRKIEIRDGRFQDDFQPYEVHLYKIR